MSRPATRRGLSSWGSAAKAGCAAGASSTGGGAASSSAGGGGRGSSRAGAASAGGGGVWEGSSQGGGLAGSGWASAAGSGLRGGLCRRGFRRRCGGPGRWQKAGRPAGAVRRAGAGPPAPAKPGPLPVQGAGCASGAVRLKRASSSSIRWSLPPGHVLQRAAQGADGPDGFPLAQGGAFGQVEVLLLGGDAAEQLPAAGQGGQHQAAVMGDQLFGQTLDVHRLLAQGGQLGQGRRGVPGRQGVRHPEQIAPVGDAGHPPDHVLVDLAGDAGAGVQDGQGVPQSAVGQAGRSAPPPPR